MPTCTLCRSQATALPGTRPQFQYSCDSGSQKRIGVLPAGVLASDESLGAESAVHIELLNAWNVECFIGVWCFMIFSHAFFAELWPLCHSHKLVNLSFSQYLNWEKNWQPASYLLHSIPGYTRYRVCLQAVFFYAADVLWLVTFLGFLVVFPSTLRFNSGPEALRVVQLLVRNPSNCNVCNREMPQNRKIIQIYKCPFFFSCSSLSLRWLLPGRFLSAR